ncbi:DnrO protein [Rhodanobacter sp. Si-c]|uniref:DnrO protein n=1 Tax=Rhodanobacter lycopersici TaxID=3162487 RepID=A0ABV3Q9D9_9GAMM
MRPMKLSLPLCGVLAVLALAPGAAFAQHDHAAHAHAAAPVPPPAQRWAADATLGTDMGQIHTVLEQLRHYEMGHMDATLALDRVSAIEESAADIFAKCRLAPEQDAVLHGMLVPLLAAVRKFKADPADMGQLAAMREAVAGYPRYFEAPGWTAETGHMH